MYKLSIFYQMTIIDDILCFTWPFIYLIYDIS